LRHARWIAACALIRGARSCARRGHCTLSDGNDKRGTPNGSDDTETNGSARRSAGACRSMPEPALPRRVSIGSDGQAASAPPWEGRGYGVQSSTWSSAVTSNYLGAFTSGGTRTQFRCDGARGRRRGRRRWSRRCERRIRRNHWQLEWVEKRCERQQRCSTVRRAKQSNWQYCRSTAREHGPK
jgi:hypothetical protein